MLQYIVKDGRQAKLKLREKYQKILSDERENDREIKNILRKVRKLYKNPIRQNLNSYFEVQEITTEKLYTLDFVYKNTLVQAVEPNPKEILAFLSPLLDITLFYVLEKKYCGPNLYLKHLNYKKIVDDYVRCVSEQDIDEHLKKYYNQLYLCLKYDFTILETGILAKLQFELERVIEDNQTITIGGNEIFEWLDEQYKKSERREGIIDYEDILLEKDLSKDEFLKHMLQKDLSGKEKIVELGNVQIKENLDADVCGLVLREKYSEIILPLIFDNKLKKFGGKNESQEIREEIINIINDINVNDEQYFDYYITILQCENNLLQCEKEVCINILKKTLKKFKLEKNNILRGEINIALDKICKELEKIQVPIIEVLLFDYIVERLIFELNYKDEKINTKDKIKRIIKKHLGWMERLAQDISVYYVMKNIPKKCEDIFWIYAQIARENETDNEKILRNFFQEVLKENKRMVLNQISIYSSWNYQSLEKERINMDNEKIFLEKILKNDRKTILSEVEGGVFYRLQNLEKLNIDTVTKEDLTAEYTPPIIDFSQIFNYIMK